MRARRSYQCRRQLEPQPKEETSGLPKILSSSAIILAVITATLYFHGRCIYQGYLSYWGLGSDLFPITTEDAFYHAGWVYFWFGLENWRYFAWIGLYVLGLYIAIFLLCAERPLRLIRKVVQTKRISAPQKAVVGGLICIIQCTLWVVLAVLVFVMLTFYGHKKGQGIAEAQHKKMLVGESTSKNKFEKVSLSFLDETGQGKTLTGYRLATSPTFCALFSEKGVRVLPLAQITAMEMVE